MNNMKESKRNYIYVILIPVVFVAFSFIQCVDDYNRNIQYFETELVNAACLVRGIEQDACEEKLNVTIKNQWKEAVIEVEGASASTVDYEYYANLYAVSRDYPLFDVEKVTFIVNASIEHTYAKRGNTLYEEN